LAKAVLEMREADNGQETELLIERFGPDELTGRRSVARGDSRIGCAPLVVAMHGGTCTSRYFDLPGYSLVQRGGSVGIPVIAIDRPGYGGTAPLPDFTETVARQAEWLVDRVGELFRRHGDHAPGVVLAPSW
jgi:pimeloyl-ACP methyl ester carboxylesterase